MALGVGYELDEASVRMLKRAVRQNKELYRDRLKPEPPPPRRPDPSRWHMWVQATSATIDGTAEAYPAKLVIHDTVANAWGDFTEVWLRLANGGVPDLTTYYWCPLEGFLDDGVAVYVFDDQAGGSVASSARVYNSSNITLAHGTPTTLTFDTDVHDTGGYHDTGSNTERLTVAAEGVYRAGLSVTMQDAGSGVALKLLLRAYANGGAIVGVNQGYTDGTGVTDLSVQVVTGDLKLSATDWIEFDALQANGSSSSLDIQAFSGYSPVAWILRVE